MDHKKVSKWTKKLDVASSSQRNIHDPGRENVRQGVAALHIRHVRFLFYPGNREVC